MPPVTPPAAVDPLHELSDRAWQTCVERLYDAVGVEAHFAEALGRFRPFFDANGVVFLAAPARREDKSVHVAACDVSLPSLAEYHSHYFVHDPWVQAAWRLDLFKEDMVVFGHDLVSPEELQASYFGQEFLSRYGVKDVLCGVIEVPPDGQRPPTFITFQRAVWQLGDFPREGAARLSALLPHLRRALRMHRRVAPQMAIGNTLAEVFEEMDLPMLFVGRGGEVVEANAAAERSMQSGPHLKRALGSTLLAHTAEGWRELNADLDALISRDNVSLALCGEPSAVLRLRRMHGALTDRYAPNRSTAVVTLHIEAASALPDESRLGLRFGLSPREAVVAMGLIRGLDPSAIATAIGIGLPTVRTHLSNLYAKTGTSGQIELVARLCGRSG